jgi:hypothetical protein
MIICYYSVNMICIGLLVLEKEKDSPDKDKKAGRPTDKGGNGNGTSESESDDSQYSEFSSDDLERNWNSCDSDSDLDHAVGALSTSDSDDGSLARY